MATLAIVGNVFGSPRLKRHNPLWKEFAPALNRVVEAGLVGFPSPCLYHNLQGLSLYCTILQNFFKFLSPFCHLTSNNRRFFG